MRITFDYGAFEDYINWSVINNELFDKINDLIKNIKR